MYSVNFINIRTVLSFLPTLIPNQLIMTAQILQFGPHIDFTPTYELLDIKATLA